MFALALRLGRTVAELLQTISSEELTEWIAYHGISPIDDARGDLQAGIVASIVANVNRSSKTPAFKPSDFMPYIDRTEEKQQGNAFVAEAKRRLNVITFVRHGRTA